MKCKNCKEEMKNPHNDEYKEIYDCMYCPTIMIRYIEMTETIVWFKEDKSKGKKK